MTRKVREREREYGDETFQPNKKGKREGVLLSLDKKNRVSRQRERPNSVCFSCQPKFKHLVSVSLYVCVDCFASHVLRQQNFSKLTIKKHIIG